VRQVRYEPFGEIRGRFDGQGVEVPLGAVSRQEYTGYVTHGRTGLQLAGIRVYDPLTGQFLQQDPAAQFFSPYAYGPGDPMNGVDPTGAFFFGLPFWLGVAIVVGSAAVIANAIYVGVTTGDVGAAFKSLFIGGVQLALGLAVLAPVTAGVLEAIGNAVVSYVVGAAALGWSAYSTVDAAKDGNIIGAISDAINLAIAAIGFVPGAKESIADWASGNGAEKGSSPGDQRGREGLPSQNGATPTAAQMQDFFATAVRETDRLIASGKVPRAADYIVDDVKFSLNPNPDNPILAGKNEIASGPINRGTITIYPRGASSLREAFVTYGHELGHFNSSWTNSERLLDRYGAAIWDVYKGGTYAGPNP